MLKASTCFFAVQLANSPSFVNTRAEGLDTKQKVVLENKYEHVFVRMWFSNRDGHTDTDIETNRSVTSYINAVFDATAWSCVPWEANSLPRSQEISRHLWNSKVHCRVQTNRTWRRGVNWIHQAQDGVHWQDLMNVMSSTTFGMEHNHSNICIGMGHTVAQFVEALHHTPEGRGFDFRLCYWNPFGRTMALGSL
jgi:hypothetical protein